MNRESFRSYGKRAHFYGTGEEAAYRCTSTWDREPEDAICLWRLNSCDPQGVAAQICVGATLSHQAPTCELTSAPRSHDGMGPFALAASPIVIVSKMPDVLPGATPILFGNLKRAYTLVDTKAVTVVRDPYSAGWCHLFKFEARIGGACTCPNAVRLLRTR